jgi:UDP-N-acetylglucosamine 2-epimerase (non-hydrolysing)
MPRRLKVLIVAGTRPEGIKMAPVWCQLRDMPEAFEPPIFCSTGQHEAMLDSVLNLFGVTVDHRLHLLAERPSLVQLTSLAISRIAQTIELSSPDWVLCQGDTTSAMCGAIAAFCMGVKVGHVEAGLRTYDRRQPYPEEVNRRIIAPTADLHFAPTTTARDNLLAERIDPPAILVTGNTVIDAVRAVVRLPDLDARVAPIRAWYEEHVGQARCIMVTGHRRENWADGLAAVMGALRDTVQRNPDVVAVYPVHLNPLVQEIATRELAGQDRIHLVPPQDYASFTWMMSRCHLLLTDSGGVQEEGPGLGKPVLVFRNVTERPEGIAAGTAILVGTDPARISAEVQRLLDDSDAYRKMAQATNPYGDGSASLQIAEALVRYGTSPAA